ncbi:MAG: glucose-6-phosphate isomerase [Clostridia bacterium]|nr:glucose-6-phosphate isomerase [Clostridia bacterium]
MNLRLDYNNVIKEYVGEHGIDSDDFNEYKDKIASAIEGMKKKKDEGKMDFRLMPFVQDDVVNDINDYVESVKEKGVIDTFVVLGIGGSALGPIAVQQALNHPYYNELTKEQRKGCPRLYVLDNVDPEKIVNFLDIVDLKKCLFNVISKSGSTSETMSQFMIIEEKMKKVLDNEDELKDHFVFTTDKEKGNLVKIGKEKGYKMFVVPSGVGGRFSELTPVGLLAAAMCGINISELLRGAKEMDMACDKTNYRESPAYMYAIIHYILMNKNKKLSVMMPYSDRLKYMSDWYCQLWAESIGKKFDNEGKEVWGGMTPIKALGVTDQHSQLQLYTEGPFDKIVVFLKNERFKNELMIPEVYGDIPEINFLGGHTQNELINVELSSTEIALNKMGKPNMKIIFPEINEYYIGQFIQMMEIATGFMGELMNINAFDQPGVEEGKNCTYAIFNKPGYEEKKKELESQKKRTDKFIC